MLRWTQSGKNVVVQLPAYNPNKMKAPYAYAIKIKEGATANSK